MFKEKLRVQVNLRETLMQRGKAGGVSQLENCLGRVRGEKSTKQIQSSVVCQSYQACGFFAESRAIKSHVNPLTIDEQGPDMMPFAAIIVTVCSDSDVVSLTYLECIVEFWILFCSVCAGKFRPILLRKALLVEFSYRSVSLQKYTWATKPEWPGSTKEYWTEQIRKASCTL